MRLSIASSLSSAGLKDFSVNSAVLLSSITGSGFPSVIRETPKSIATARKYYKVNYYQKTTFLLKNISLYKPLLSGVNGTVVSLIFLSVNNKEPFGANTSSCTLLFSSPEIE